MTQAGNTMPILSSVDPRNIHFPSTMSMLNIVDLTTETNEAEIYQYRL